MSTIYHGDSYSSVESAAHDESKPNTADPLGLPFPGSKTGLFNEPDKPNWVGHLITKFRPGPKYTPSKLRNQSEAWIEHPLLIHDYARAIESLFLPGLGKKPTTAPWVADATLFGEFICTSLAGFSQFILEDSVMTKLFGLQDQLYDAGARNFLFIDVPPIHLREERRTQAKEKVDQWNTNLRQAAEKFSSAHEDASVFIFSSFKLFNTLLDDPKTFGFKATDVSRYGGTIWVDHIHPTSQVHEYIARHATDFLSDIPADSSQQKSSQ
ncbi:hypothetical protein BDZ97DRAFT_1904151 [Flammula alnicola]|nr:hypothetical protein BDZ97DRAFT_1904151 [Flammula alnicola]